MPLIQKAPPAPTESMVTLVVPELVRVCVLVTPVPKGTLPKLMLAGLAVREPLVRPVPLTEMRREEVDPEFTRRKLPWMARLSNGAKTILKDAVLPGAMVKGIGRPLRVNSGAYFSIDVMVMGTDCELVRVTAMVLDWLTFTVPKPSAHGAH